MLCIYTASFVNFFNMSKEALQRCDNRLYLCFHALLKVSGCGFGVYILSLDVMLVGAPTKVDVCLARYGSVFVG